MERKSAHSILLTKMSSRNANENTTLKSNHCVWTRNFLLRQGIDISTEWAKELLTHTHTHALFTLRVHLASHITHNPAHSSFVHFIVYFHFVFCAASFVFVFLSAFVRRQIFFRFRVFVMRRVMIPLMCENWIRAFCVQHTFGYVLSNTGNSSIRAIYFYWITPKSTAAANINVGCV